MSEVLLPMIEGEWKKPPVEPGPSLITPLGLIEGEALTALEQAGVVPMRRLIRELDWPAPMVIMAVGALIRQGLVRATRHDLEVMIESAPMPAAPTQGRIPEVWGG